MFLAVLDTNPAVTRDFLPRWLIALIVGVALAGLAAPPDASHEADPLLFTSVGAPIPERAHARSPDQPRGALHHYVVPGTVSESAAGAAGAHTANPD